MCMGGNRKRIRDNSRETQDTRGGGMVMMDRIISRSMNWKVLNSCVV